MIGGWRDVYVRMLIGRTDPTPLGKIERA